MIIPAASGFWYLELVDGTKYNEDSYIRRTPIVAWRITEEDELGNACKVVVEPITSMDVQDNGDEGISETAIEAPDGTVEVRYDLEHYGTVEQFLAQGLRHIAARQKCQAAAA